MCKKDWQSNKTRLSTGVADLDGSGPREGSRVALSLQKKTGELEMEKDRQLEMNKRQH